MSSLREIDRSLFVADRRQRFAGLEVGTRMTVIRLGDGSLFLHSPVALDAALARELGALGTIRYLVAPNRFHHLYIGQYANLPGAELYATPGVPQKRPEIPFCGELSDAPPSGWAKEIDQVFICGYPLHNEICFFHQRTRTLLMSDLVFNLGAGSSLLTRLALRMIGGHGFGPTWFDRVAIKDWRAMRQSLDRVLAWDFDRLVMAHGQVVEQGARDLLRASYSWL